jgi:4a-hydroxytetrahydrobiopterin dehydratase
MTAGAGHPDPPSERRISPGDPSRARSYRPLSAAEVAAVLPALDDWIGDTGRLSRTVVTDDVDGLLARVAAVEAELDHHAAVERESGVVTFRLWTHVRDAVTALDVELAQRIDDLVAAS